jgi:adenylate cyclase
LAGDRVEGQRPAAKPLPLPDKPSIAVLPFTNMSGDPEQEYFADGIAEDIITSLARFPRLFVIARNSSFTFKGQAVDLKHVGRELGVRYILEGSIRRAGNRVRITGQLIEAEAGTHLWADRFDGDLTDIFALQDEITERVIGAIEPRLRQAEIEAAARKRPYSIAAYDLYLRALPHFHSMTREGLDEALRFLYQALEADPRYSAAAGLAALIRGYRTASGWAESPPQEIEESLRLARLAVDLDSNDPEALSCAGRMMGYAGRDYQGAVEMVDRATQLCPNSAFAWSNRGWTYVYAARPAEAVDFLQRAIRFSPLDPLRYEALAGLGLAYLQLGLYEDAADVARKSAQLNRYFSTTFRCLAAALAHLRQLEEARAAAQHLLQVEPNFTISRWNARSRWKYPAKEDFISGMRKAGLPE